MPWRLITAILAIIALIASIALITGQAWQIAIASIVGLAAIVINTVAIRQAPGKGSKLLLLLTIPTLLWTVGVFVWLGMIFPRIGAGTYSTAVGGYRILIPEGYMGRVETIHGSLILASGPAAALSTTSVSGARAASGTTLVAAVTPSPIYKQSYSEAIEQAGYNEAKTKYQQSGNYVSDSRHMSIHNGSVWEMVTRDSATGEQWVSGSVLLPDRKRMVSISVYLPTGVSITDGIAIFNEIADSIQQY